MSSCLGLYVESNLIKYAKVSKEHDKVKVEAFGINFYEDLDKAINQIIEETDSYKTPISINLSDEMYSYFDMFALLSKKDLDKAITTEFELSCSDKGQNPNVYETRYAVTNYPDDKEKLKVIHVAANKIDLNKKIQSLSGYKLTNIVPISMSITNLIETKPKENYLIVNIEEKTTVTTIVDERIYDINVLEEGSKEFLRKINAKENSYPKSYEICKNTTIYTSEVTEIKEDETSYLEDIMPTLYNIVGNVKKIINESIYEINKVYITGTATLINNIDLYFQEYLNEASCEILKPMALSSTKDKINIKDYIEVNSAISLALYGDGEGIEGINFKKQGFNEKMPDWLKVEVGSTKTKGNKNSKSKSKNSKLSGKISIKNDLKEKLDKTEFSLIRVAVGIILLFIIYSAFSIMISNQMDKKDAEAKRSKQNTQSQILLVESDNTKIQSKTNEYTKMIENLQNLNDKITDATKTRDAIPNLLNSIMFIIPESVQITGIQNTSGTHIVINAQSDKYEQLGMFKAKIETGNYLTNVISTAGQKDGSVVTVKIEGDLP